MCVCVCLACVPDPRTNKTLGEKGTGSAKKDLEQMFCWPSVSLPFSCARLLLSLPLFPLMDAERFVLFVWKLAGLADCAQAAGK